MLVFGMVDQNLTTPLAERMRPKSLVDYVGQEHLLGAKGTLKRMLDAGVLPSLILWGGPGTGKTTLSLLLAEALKRPFFQLSAVQAGVKDVREIIESAEKRDLFSSNRKTPILFIDEIHRFSKSQQDSLLAAVEKGVVTLIGATTENPSFEVIGPLLSRCQVLILNQHSEEELIKIAQRAIQEDWIFKTKNIHVKEWDALLRISGGDARRLLNALEIVITTLSSNTEIEINNEVTTQIIQNNISTFDKAGEVHYNIASALIKSIRGSDPNAALYWLARMIEGGEDCKFIARRLVIAASEDIGLANPNAMLIADACFRAAENIGFPEASIILSNTVVYLAMSEKSNSSYVAIKNALHEVKKSGDLAVPLHLRNAPTKLMKNIGYGADYQYPHDFEGNFVKENYMPNELEDAVFYNPGNNNHELNFEKKLKRFWSEKYK